MSVLFFVFGLFIGSFLLVVIERLPRNESILFGRSHCDMCGHTLAWYDLMPIFSYLLLGGKCRYCHKSYGMTYPIVEILTGLLFTSIPLFVPFQSIVGFVAMLCIVSACIVIFFSDLWYGFIPDEAVLVMLIASLPLVISSVEQVLVHSVVGLLSGGVFLFLFLVTKKRGIGFGDVKLVTVMGFLLGFPFIILALYIAFLTGAAVALILILGRKKRFHGDTISFGPFLILGLYTSLIWGLPLWNFFIHLLNI